MPISIRESGTSSRSDSSSLEVTLASSLQQRSRTAIRKTARLFRRNPTMAFGLLIVLGMIILSIAAPLITPRDPKDINTYRRLLSLSAEDWLGTDQLGRDVYSRTIYGTRVSLLVGFSVAAATAAVGTIIGLVSGYFRRVDMVMMRVVDGVMSIPGLLLAIAFMAMFGASVKNVVIALTITSTPGVARLVRSQVLSLRDQEFVEAARAIGARSDRILRRHVFPQTVAPLIVQGTYICATAILVEAALSFLGAGSPPSIPSWGNMMAEGQMYLRTAIWIAVFPGILLTVTVMGINLAGDGLRDTLDPKLRRRV